MQLQSEVYPLSRTGSRTHYTSSDPGFGKPGSAFSFCPQLHEPDSYSSSCRWWAHQVSKVFKEMPMAHRSPLFQAVDVGGSTTHPPGLAGVYDGCGCGVRNEWQRWGRRGRHGSFWVQETVGAQHHGLDFEFCKQTYKNCLKEYNF